jgi:hypothetical protein
VHLEGNLCQMRLRTCVGVAILAMCLSAADIRLSGQTPAAVDLASIQGLKCSFARSSRVVWKNGVPEPTIRSAGVLTFEFKDFNSASGTAAIVNPTGTHDVTLQAGERTLSFLEVSPGGRIAMTVVFATISTGSRLVAAYSRTDYLPIDLPGFKSDPEVSQYYGDCEPTR